MRTKTMDLEQQKKPGSVHKQTSQGTAPVPHNAASPLQTGLLAIQAGLGNRYVQRMVDHMRVGQGDRETVQPARPDLKDGERRTVPACPIS